MALQVFKRLGKSTKQTHPGEQLTVAYRSGCKALCIYDFASFIYNGWDMDAFVGVDSANDNFRPLLGTLIEILL